MGAQVYNQMVQRVHQSPAPPLIKTSMRPVPNRVKCNLFGKVQSAALKEFVDEQIKEQIDAKSKKWGFNFATGQPMKNGTMDWKPVRPTESVAVPTMITLTQSAHAIPTTRRETLIRRSMNNSGSSSSSSSLSMDDLMDEQARRANEPGGDRVGKDILDESATSTSSTTSPLSPAVASSEDSESESIETYPTLRSSARLLRKHQCDSTRRSSSPASPLRMRQPQITEFLKERKRLSSSTASVQRVSVKKLRLMTAGGNAATTSTPSN